MTAKACTSRRRSISRRCNIALLGLKLLVAVALLEDFARFGYAAMSLKINASTSKVGTD